MCLERLYTRELERQFLHEYQKNVSTSERIWVCVYTIGSFFTLKFFIFNVINVNKNDVLVLVIFDL